MSLFGHARDECSGGGSHRIAHALMVLSLCLLIALPFLGWSGLAYSEGHRAIPGWSMLATGDWMRVELFDQPYLRKPPGMPWAIAASSAVFGMTEFAARVPSAVAFALVGLVIWWHGSRWFGSRAGLACGLAHALLPLNWESARSAEIESLHQLGLALATCVWMDLLFSGGSRTRPRLFATVTAGAVGVSIAVLAKGPAVAALFLAILIGAAVTFRSPRKLASIMPWLVLLTGTVVAGAVALPVLWTMTSGSGKPIVEGVNQFLWGGEGAGAWSDHVLLPIRALGAAMPCSMALLFLRRPVNGVDNPQRMAIGLGISWLAWIVVLIALGVSNARYAMPGAPLLCLFAGWAITKPGVETVHLRSVHRLLARPLCVLIVMATVAAVAVPLRERSRQRNSGVSAGLDIAAHLGATDIVWADGAVEARPETLWYASRQSGCTVLWKRDEIRGGTLPPAGTFLLLRDDTSHELSGFERHTASLIERAQASTSGYVFRLYEVITPIQIRSSN